MIYGGKHWTFLRTDYISWKRVKDYLNHTYLLVWGNRQAETSGCLSSTVL